MVPFGNRIGEGHQQFTLRAKQICPARTHGGQVFFVRANYNPVLPKCRDSVPKPLAACDDGVGEAGEQGGILGEAAGQATQQEQEQ